MEKIIWCCRKQKIINVSEKEIKDLMTGGMGAVSPVPFATPGFMYKVEERIIKPTIDGLV